MKVLVTGGAGFIGSHIVDKLIEQQCEVYLYDNFSAEQTNIAPGVKSTRTGDLARISSVPMGCDAIVHCAARADVASNWRNAEERQRMWASNIEGTTALLEVSRGIPTVMLSTLAVYGDNPDCQENEACRATSPYAASKLAGEALLQAYAFEAKTPWHVLRLGCVMGARYHHGHIADFVTRAKQVRRDFRNCITSCIAPLSDGRISKSAVHALDVADAVYLALRGTISSGVYNTATGPWSPRDTIREMGCESVTEWPVDRPHGWVGDPMAVANSAKLRAAGWVPRRSVAQGVREALVSLNWPESA